MRQPPKTHITPPDGSGLDFRAELRAAGCAAPVLMLTANDTELDTATGLARGADDYVTKPFSLAVLRCEIGFAEDEEARWRFSFPTVSRRVITMGESGTAAGVPEIGDLIALRDERGASRDFAVLQSIGMTGRQLRRMLFAENVVYTALTAAFTLTAGLAFGRAVTRLIAGRIWFFNESFSPYTVDVVRAMEAYRLVCEGTGVGKRCLHIDTFDERVWNERFIYSWRRLASGRLPSAHQSR